MAPTNSPLQAQQPPGLLQNILNFLFGQKALQQAAQPPAPAQQPGIVPQGQPQNTNYLQNQVANYMMNLKQQQEEDKKKKKPGQ